MLKTHKPYSKMTDPDLREPEAVPMPSQLWQPWTLIVPAILLLPMLSLAFAWQISPSSDADLRRPAYHHPRGDDAENSATPTDSGAETEPTPMATLPPIALLQKLTYYAPDAQGQLRAKTFSTTSAAGKADFAALGSAALNALIPDATKFFPPGTGLQKLTLDEAEPPLARVSLNEKFWNSDYWSGISRTDAAMQAIAHTLEAAYQQSGGQGSLHIQLMRDEHEMDVLGEYDVRVPYTPDPALVAETSSQTSSVNKP